MHKICIFNRSAFRFAFLYTHRIHIYVSFNPLYLKIIINYFKIKKIIEFEFIINFFAMYARLRNLHLHM